jgi:hypothetical protein
MKSSTPFNSRSTIESATNSGSVNQHISYRIEQRFEQNDFDPALELKRLRQELIERLLIIQRKAAINANSEKQAQLSITITPKTTQHTTNPLQKPNPTNNHNNAEILQLDKTYSNTNHGISPDNLENSAERIMANIESARECISKLQVPNISQPLPKLKTNKQPEQLKNTTTLPSPNKTNNKINNSHHNITQSTNRQTYQTQLPKNDFNNEPFGISLLQKLNIGLAIIGVAGILLGTFYLLNNNTNNIQPGVPVLFVGLILIVAGITGHLLQEYTNNNTNIRNSM